jgi:hypothetical protein
VGEWRYSSATLELSIKWRLVVSFIPLLFYPQGKSSRYLGNRRLCGPQSQSGCCGEEKNLDLVRDGILVVQLWHIAISTQVPKFLHI